MVEIQKAQVFKFRWVIGGIEYKYDITAENEREAATKLHDALEQQIHELAKHV